MYIVHICYSHINMNCTVWRYDAYPISSIYQCASCQKIAGGSAGGCQPPIGCKHLRDISYTSRVIANFVTNFVAMATGVGRDRIWLASFNSPPRKTPVIHKDLADISYVSRVIAVFVPNFVAMATGGHMGVNLYDAIK